MPKMPVRVGFALSWDMMDELEAFARHQDRSVSDVLRRLVRDALEKARDGNQSEVRAAS